MSSQNQAQPVTKYRKDYQLPSHNISQIKLEFNLADNETIVTAVSTIKQIGDN